MKRELLGGLLILGMVVVAGYGGLRMGSTPSEVTTAQEETFDKEQIVAPSPCVPTFMDGGGPYYLDNAPLRSNIAPDVSSGERLLVKGRIWNGDCRAVRGGVVLDIWQASEEGEYDDAWYRGRVLTNEDGSFEFSTIIPEGYGEGTGYRPPHIHFKVWEGEQLLVTSQMFFPEVAGRPGFDDAFIVDIWQVEGGWEAWHDIVVGG